MNESIKFIEYYNKYWKIYDKYKIEWISDKVINKN